MKSVIEELYYSNWGGQIFVKTGREYGKSVDRAERIALKLEELLKKNSEALEAFRKFRDMLDEAISYELIDFYKAGFRNGVQLMTDAFRSEE